MNDKTLPSDNQLHFRKKLLQKMAVGEKINQSITKLSKTKINMIKLDKQTLSSGHVYEFLTDKNVLPEKDLK